MASNNRRSEPAPSSTSQDIQAPSLSSLGIHLSEIIGSFVCEPCGHVLDVSSPILFRRHLREKHGITITQANVLCKSATAEISSTCTNHPLRSEYYSGTTTLGHSLLPIKGLPKRKGQQCGDCFRVFTAGSGFVNHRRRVHGDREPKILQASTPIVTCQSLLSRHRDMKLFILQVDNQSPISVTCSEKVADEFLRFSSKRGRVDTNDEPELSQDWARSTFVSMTRAAERLRSLGLSVADGASLCSARLGHDTHTIKACLNPLTRALVTMFREAQAIACDFRRPYYVRTDFSTPGLYSKTRRFYFLKMDEQGNHSITKYSNRARILVSIAVRVWCARGSYPFIRMNTDFRESVRKYVEYCESQTSEIEPSDNVYQELLHSLLFDLFFESQRDCFSSVVHACICTCWDTNRAKRARGLAGAELADAAVYSNASKTGQTLAGIMYCVTCVAILKAYKYNGEKTEDEVHAWLKDSLVPGSPFGYTTLVELRSLCTTLRPFEVARTEFTPCTDKSHGLCGFTKQIELSTMGIGKSIRRLQDMARTLMFDNMLLGRQLPVGYESGIDGLVDNLDNNAIGYSAINGHENETFIKSCDYWLHSLMRENGGHFQSVEWRINAKRLLILFLALIHLSSGSPGRGTEIASYHITNTRATKRNIYFQKGEVMFVPHYDKRRAITGGKVQFITRHSDKETSYLFKSYLLFVHRAHQTFLLEKNIHSTEKYGVHHLLTMGIIARKQISSAISSALKSSGFPMNLQTYRHHQTGLLKERCQRENLSTVWLHLFGSNDREVPSDEEGDDLEALDRVQECSLEQAAHSVKTAFEKYAQYSSKNGSISLQKVQTRIELNRKAAKAWHRDCGLLPQFLSDTSGERINGTSKTQLNQEIAGTQDPAQTDQSARNAPILNSSLWNGSAHAELKHVRAPAAPSLELTLPINSKRNILNDFNELPESYLALKNGFDPEKALHRAISPNARWKSAEQRVAMLHVAKNKHDLLVNIQTGGGKSVTVLAPILFESGFTLWISPLRALRLETSQWMSSSKVNVYDLESVNLQRWKELGNIILVSPEVVGSALFLSVQSRLQSKNILNRVVIDEAHLILTMQWFRPCMKRTGAASNWGTSCNVVLLTATAPPAILPQIAKVCGVDVESFKTVRGDPRRTNLGLRVKKVHNNRLRETVKALSILCCRNYKGNRCIVYCLTVVFLEELFHYFKEDRFLKENAILLKYHGQLTTELSCSSMELWRKSVPPNKALLMIATDAFGCGIDVPDVRNVIIAGGCRSLVELWQQGGRAGRDGKKAAITVVYDPSACDSIEHVVGSEYFLRSSCGDFKQWCEDLHTCRRLKIESCITGWDMKHIRSCLRDPGAEKCDNCETNGSACAEPAIDPRSQRNPDELNNFNPNSSAYVRKLRQAQVRIWKSGKQWLQSTSLFLQGRCLYCLLMKPLSSGSTSLNRNEVIDLLHCSMSCRSRCWPVKYCFRCRQSNHAEAKKCNYLRSYYNPSCQSPASEPFRCGSCFVRTIGGRDVHDGQFAHHCPVKNCSSFCLTAFSVPEVQSIILSDSSPFGQALKKGLYVHVEDVYERYIAWLTEDTPDHDAGLLVMTQYLFQKLSLEKLKDYV